MGKELTTQGISVEEQPIPSILGNRLFTIAQGKLTESEVGRSWYEAKRLMYQYVILKRALWRFAGVVSDTGDVVRKYTVQEDYIQDLDHLPQREGGMNRSTLFDKMKQIEIFRTSGKDLWTSCLYVASQPGAAYQLGKQENVGVLPIAQIIDETIELPASEARARVNDEKKQPYWFIKDAKWYFRHPELHTKNTLELILTYRSYDGDGWTKDDDDRVKLFYDITYEEAQCLVTTRRREVQDCSIVDSD